MRRTATLIIGLILVLAACGPQDFTEKSTTTPSTTVPAGTQTTTTTTTQDGSPTTSDPDDQTSFPADHAGWVREEWPVLESVDPWAAAWGDSGLVVLGYAAFDLDDSPTPNGLWLSTDGGWHETLIRDVTIADQYGFTPEVTDLVWFGGRYLAFLMGDTTTTPGRASMLTSNDGINWKLEYLGSTPTAALPAGLYATPESPPWPGTSAIARVRMAEGNLVAVGWTILDTGDNFISVPVIWQSTDGRSWSTTAIPNAHSANEWGSDVAFGRLGYLVEAAGPVHQSAYLWFSANGDDWTYIGDRFDNQWRNLIGIAVADEAMLALMMDLETEGQPLSLWRSTNGLDWQEIPAPFLDAEYAEGWRLADVTCDQQGLVALAVMNGETRTWRSADGMSWTRLPSVVMPTGEALIRPFPLWPQATVTSNRLELVATAPGMVVRWREASETRSVILVASDDVLNVRSGPGVGNDIVATLSPAATGVPLTGRELVVGSSTWVEIVVDDVTGWVNERYLADPESAANPFSESHAVDLVDELAAAFAGRGDLTEASSRRGIFVVHHDQPQRFTNLDELLTDPTLYAWTGTGCSPEECADEMPHLTFAEAVADSFLSAWNDEDRQVAVDEVIPGGNGLIPEFIVPTEFSNLHYVAIKDPGDNPDYEGMDWFTWYVYFTYENDVPVLLGMSIDQWSP